MFDELLPELQRLGGTPHELLRVVQLCGENQQILRGHFNRYIGFFLVEALKALLKTRCDPWLGSISALRLVECVLLNSMTAPEDRPQLCELLQAVLRSRTMPPRGASGRLEAACMCLLEPQVQILYAPERHPRPGPRQGLLPGTAAADVLEERLTRLVDSLLPTAQTLELRERAFEAFDAVIFRRFGVHGRQFGSAVNGFQMQSSDIDVSVLIPPDLQARIIAEAQERAEGAPADSEATAAFAGMPNIADWHYLEKRLQMKMACIAATRALAEELRRSGLTVVETIEAARVPIVKCRHAVPFLNKESDKEGEIEFDVDISFCNEVAYHNSRLLRAYSDFDTRARALGVLVKYWAKRRKINSPFDGTLSSYSYSIMVVHYLQVRGILPNLQCPSIEALAATGRDAVDQVSLEGCHNVWFLNPSDYGTSSSEGEEGCRQTAVPIEAWFGAQAPPELNLRELFYGFFRYFAVEFNSYSSVVTIRLPDVRPTKAEYFSVQVAEGGEHDVLPDAAMAAADGDIADQAAADAAEAEAMEAEDAAEEGREEDDRARGLPDVDTPMGSPELVAFAASGDELNLPALPPSVVAAAEANDIVRSDFFDSEDEVVLTGRMKSYDAEAGSGLIIREGGDGGEVWFNREEHERSGVCDGDSVSFAVTSDADGKLQARGLRHRPPPWLGGDDLGRSPLRSALEAEETALETAAAEDSSGAPVAFAASEGGGGAVEARCSEPDTNPFWGSVKTFNEETGFGFVACDATFQLFHRDVFLHHRQMKAAEGVKVGDFVSFSLELNLKGQPQARRVSKIDKAAAKAASGQAFTSEDTDAMPAEEAVAAAAVGGGVGAEEAAAINLGGGAAADLTTTAIVDSADWPAAALTTAAGGGGAAAAVGNTGHGGALQGPSHGAPVTSYAVQKRIGDRPCLCIDDPFEKNRVLGTTFIGHELFCRELLRALSILKKGGEKTCEELLKERETSPTRRRDPQREFSPIPQQMQFMRPDGEVKVSVQIEKAIKKDLVGRVIGQNGNVIKMIRDNAGLEDARIHEYKGSGSMLLLKGEPENVRQALLHVEQVTHGPKQRNREAYAASQQSPGLGPAGAKSPFLSPSPGAERPMLSLERQTSAGLGTDASARTTPQPKAQALGGARGGAVKGGSPRGVPSKGGALSSMSLPPTAAGLGAGSMKSLSPGPAGGRLSAGPASADQYSRGQPPMMNGLQDPDTPSTPRRSSVQSVLGQYSDQHQSPTSEMVVRSGTGGPILGTSMLRTQPPSPQQGGHLSTAVSASVPRRPTNAADLEAQLTAAAQSAADLVAQSAAQSQQLQLGGPRTHTAADFEAQLLARSTGSRNDMDAAQRLPPAPPSGPNPSPRHDGSRPEHAQRMLQDAAQRRPAERAEEPPPPPPPERAERERPQDGKGPLGGKGGPTRRERPVIGAGKMRSMADLENEYTTRRRSSINEAGASASEVDRDHEGLESGGARGAEERENGGGRSRRKHRNIGQAVGSDDIGDSSLGYLGGAPGGASGPMPDASARAVPRSFREDGYRSSERALPTSAFLAPESGDGVEGAAASGRSRRKNKGNKIPTNVGAIESSPAAPNIKWQ